MSNKNKSSLKRLKLKADQIEAQLILNCGKSSLEVVSKHREEKEQFWGNFILSDFDQQCQALLQTIDSLYEYICDNTEEVEVQKQRISINLNFLKQTKTIELKLHSKIMFSLEEHHRLLSRISTLEEQTKNLKSKEQLCRKLTFEFSEETVNLQYYSFANLNQIKPYQRKKQLSLFRICQKNCLPKVGFWNFNILVSEVQKLGPVQLNKEVEREFPFVLIGVINEEGEKVQVKLSALADKYSRGDLQQSEPAFIGQQELLKIVINANAKTLTVDKCFERGQKKIDWGRFKRSDRLWLILKLHRVVIKCDLFTDERQVECQNSQQEERASECFQ